MPKINSRVAANVLLAALEFKAGNRKAAGRYLAVAASDEDFDETLEGLQDAAEGDDPFVTEAGDDDFDLDLGPDDETEDEDEDDTEQEVAASLVRDAKRARSGVGAGSRKRATAEVEKIGGNEGPEGADRDNDSDEEVRKENPEVARLQMVRRNLTLLANAR